MKVGQEVKEKNSTLESMKLKASAEVNPDLRASLTDAQEGIFRPGALPKVEGVSASASKALMQTFGQAGRAHPSKVYSLTFFIVKGKVSFMMMMKQGHENLVGPNTSPLNFPQVQVLTLCAAEHAGGRTKEKGKTREVRAC